MNSQNSLFELIKGFLLLALYISPFVAISFILIHRMGKRDISNEKKYEKLYKEIQGLINEGDLTLPRKEFIKWKLNELSLLSYKNPEKTSVLRNNFLVAINKKQAKSNIKEFNVPQQKTVSHECSPCGYQNSENCNTCDVLNPQFR